MTVTKEYVVGAKLPPSGLFVQDANGGWQHAGFNHPFIFSLDYDAADPSIVYLAAGNGLIRSSEHGGKWKILTGSDVTELLYEELVVLTGIERANPSSVRSKCLSLRSVVSEMMLPNLPRTAEVAACPLFRGRRSAKPQFRIDFLS